MSIFAVNYFYSAPEEQLAAVRADHREWLSQQLKVGALLASGPMVEIAGALLIFQADSPEALAELLDHDPFDIAGFIGERAIAQWNPIFGPWS